MLAGRSRIGSPMRRTMRVLPTSGDRSTRGGPTDVDDDPEAPDDEAVADDGAAGDGGADDAMSVRVGAFGESATPTGIDVGRPDGATVSACALG